MNRGNRGFALVLTLIVTALLVALVVEFIAEVYVDTSSKQSYVDAQKAGLMAESGVSGAVAMLQLALSKQSYTSLHDLWAKPIELPEEQGSLRVTVEDENARLSLNHIAGATGIFTEEKSYYGIALRLFRGLKLPASDLCDAVADWRDSDAITKPGGAESQWYASRKPVIAVKNNLLGTVEELALVKGFNADVFEKISPFVTVYPANSPAAEININTASKELLTALDERITASLAEQIIAYRKSTPFQNRYDFLKVPGMDKIAQELMLLITVKSSIFRIKAEAQVNGTTRVVEAVASFAGAMPALLYWREY